MLLQKFFPAVIYIVLSLQLKRSYIKQLRFNLNKEFRFESQQRCNAPTNEL